MASPRSNPSHTPSSDPSAQSDSATPKPSRLSRALWGTALNAHPTLRGLLVVPKAGEPAAGPGELFPWQRVQSFGNSGFWSVLDEDGQPLKRDGRPVCLQVNGWHTKRVAKRLQERHLRHAWDNRTLSIAADLRRDLPPRWPVVVLALFLGATLTMMFRSIWLMPPRVPLWQSATFTFVKLDGRSLMWLLWASCVFAAVLFCVALWRSVAKVNTTWIRFQRADITATLKDGSTVLQSWDSLTTIDRSFTSLLLTFGTGTILRMELGRSAGLLRPVLAVIRQNVLKKPAVREGELTRPEIVRIGIYCLVACIVGALVIGLTPPEARRVIGIEAFALFLSGIGVLWGILAASVFMPPLLARSCSRWRRHRRRRLGSRRESVTMS